jgi:hypothetical protein
VLTASSAAAADRPEAAVLPAVVRSAVVRSAVVLPAVVLPADRSAEVSIRRIGPSSIHSPRTKHGSRGRI